MSRYSLAFRSLAVVFSAGIVSTYLACSQKPADDPKRGMILPGSKSAAMWVHPASGPTSGPATTTSDGGIMVQPSKPLILTGSKSMSATFIVEPSTPLPGPIGTTLPGLSSATVPSTQPTSQP